MNSSSFKIFFTQNLAEKKENFGYRWLRSIQKRQQQYIYVDNQKLIDFSSNDYLGLSQNKTLLKQVNSVFSSLSLGGVSSRLISGNLSLYEKLEQKISEWKKSSNALFFSSGYQANIGVMSTLADRYTEVFSDKLNHASIIDGVILSRAKLIRYKHLNYFNLESSLQKSCAKKKIIVSESIFSMDGDCADIEILGKLAQKYDALLIIDDAHGSGLEKISYKDIDVYIATFSKTLGSFGGMVCCNELIYQYLINYCRSFIYTTAMAPRVIAQNLVAVEYIQSPQAKKLLTKLKNNIKKVRTYLRDIGLQTIESNSAIIPIIIGSTQKTLKAEQILMGHKIFAVAIRPPTVPESMARLRLTVSALHTQRDLQLLFKALEEIKNFVKKGK